MKSALELKYNVLRQSAEALVKAAHPTDFIEVMCSFSEWDCVADVKTKNGWLRYILIEGVDEPDKLRRIS